MILYINPNGSLIEGKTLKDRDYMAMYNKVDVADILALETFLLQDVGLKPFSVTTKYPNPWPKELSVIYHTFDEELSRQFLGKIIWNLLHGSPDRWIAIKSKLPNHIEREYESMFYAPV